MKVLIYVLSAFGILFLGICAVTIIAHVTGAFSITAYISAGREDEDRFGISLWRCTSLAEYSSVCNGYTINETGIARTSSGGGRPH